MRKSAVTIVEIDFADLK